MMKQTYISIFLFLLLHFWSFQTFSQIYEIKQGDKWGFIDVSGKVIVPAQYDFVYDDYEFSLQSEGYFAFLQDKKMGVYHVDRKEIVAPMYERVKVHGDDALSGYIEVQKEGKIGVLDTLGKTLLAPLYDEIRLVLPNVFAVAKEGLWGIWSPDGRFDIEPSFHGFQAQKERYLLGWRGELYYAWDQNGTQRVADFQGPVSFLNNHTLRYREYIQDSTLTTDSLTLMGLLDSTGARVTEPIFDTLFLQRGFIRAEQKGSVQLFDPVGKSVFDTSYFDIRIDWTGRIWVENDFKWGIFEFKADTLRSLFPLCLSRSGRFRGNVAVVQAVAGAGLLNQFGELVIDTIYEDIRLQYGNAMVLEDLRKGYRQIPLTEEGRLATKKRLVIRGENSPEQLDLSSPWLDDTPFSPIAGAVEPRDYGWFRFKKLWGWQDTASKRIFVKPQYTDVQVYPEIGLTMALIDIGKSDDRQVALIDHVTGRTLIPKDKSLNMIYMRDFESNSVARAQYSTGAFCLVDRRGAISRLKQTAYIGPFSEGIAPACVSLLYSKLPKNPQAENPHLRDGMQGKWGYVTERGVWGKEASFQTALAFSNGIGVFKLNDKWGALDTNFQEIIPPIFDAIKDPAKVEAKQASPDQPPSTASLIATVVNRKKIFYLNEDGNLLFSRKYDESKDFHEGLAAVKIGRKWGYVNREGKLVIPAEFDRAGDFHEGLARVRRRMRWGFINPEGNYQIESIYHLAGDFVDGVAMVKYKGKYGYLNLQGKWHIRPRFKKAGDFYKGQAIARGSGWTGVINTEGEWIIPPKYSRIWRTENGFFRVKRKGVFGYYAPNGVERLTAHYRMISEKFDNGIARVNSYQGWGYINTNYELILPAEYNFVKPFKFQMGLVRKGRKVGVVDQRGEFILPLEYAGIVIVSYGQFRVQEKERGSWQNLDLRQELPAKPLVAPVYVPFFEKVKGKFGYDEVHDPEESIIVAATHQLYGLADYKGNILFEPQFESIKYVNGLYKVINDGNIGYLNREGEWVYEIPIDD